MFESESESKEKLLKLAYTVFSILSSEEDIEKALILFSKLDISLRKDSLTLIKNLLRRKGFSIPQITKLENILNQSFDTENDGKEEYHEEMGQKKVKIN